jgi:hypothetical protein
VEATFFEKKKTSKKKKKNILKKRDYSKQKGLLSSART